MQLQSPANSVGCRLDVNWGGHEINHLSVFTWEPGEQGERECEDPRHVPPSVNVLWTEMFQIPLLRAPPWSRDQKLASDVADVNRVCASPKTSL